MTPIDRNALLAVVAHKIETTLADRTEQAAAAVLAAIDAAGLVIVPAEETEAMLDAAIMAEAAGDDSWAAKLRASPFLPR